MTRTPHPRDNPSEDRIHPLHTNTGYLRRLRIRGICKPGAIA